MGTVLKKKNENLPKVLNSPEGSISNKTYDSIKFRMGFNAVQSNL